MQSKVILGDCLEELLKLQNKSIDMILIDLPYNLTRNKWDTVLDLNKLWLEFYRIKRDRTTPMVFTASQPFTSKLIMSNLKDFKYEWIWDKGKGGNFLNVKKQPFREHESVLVFSEKSHMYKPIMQERRENLNSKNRRKYRFKSKASKQSNNYNEFNEINNIKLNELRYPSSIQKFTPEYKKYHPTQKPVKLFEYMIKTYTNEGDIVLDCCAGSGTTAIACLNTNRNYMCIEKNIEFFNIIQKRISEWNYMW